VPSWRDRSAQVHFAEAGLRTGGDSERGRPSPRPSPGGRWKREEEPSPAARHGRGGDQGLGRCGAPRSFGADRSVSPCAPIFSSAFWAFVRSDQSCHSAPSTERNTGSATSRSPIATSADAAATRVWASTAFVASTSAGIASLAPAPISSRDAIAVRRFDCRTSSLVSAAP
jgi:hypothetical protein